VTLVELFDFLNGRGIRVSVPRDLKVESADEDALYLRGGQNELVTLRCHALELVVHPSLLDVYRHDLRLEAAALGGGLVDCNLIEGVGVVGITKRRSCGDHGFTYIGTILAPANPGYVSITIGSKEGVVSGVREGLAEEGLREKYGLAWLEGWCGDPYGFEFERHVPSFWKRLRDGRRHRGYDARKLALWTLSDDAQYDIPGHPLTIVRTRLKEFMDRLDQSAPWPREPGLHVSSTHGFSFRLPPGFRPYADGQSSREDVYVRPSFSRTTTFSVTEQPDFPKCAYSAGAAEEMARLDAATSGTKLTHGPRAQPLALGPLEGVHCETHGVHRGRAQYWASVCLLWDEFPVQFSILGSPDDRGRLDGQLKEVVVSLSAEATRVRGPAVAPLTKRA